MPHIHEKIDFTAEVFIVHNNKVLLRLHDKYKFWLSIGGHIELDEDPNQAAVREVKEEVGLDITLYQAPQHKALETENYKELIPPQFMNRHKINDTHEHVTLTYFATSTTDQLTLCENEKSDGCKWFTKEELDDPKYKLKQQVKLYAHAALETLRKTTF